MKKIFFGVLVFAAQTVLSQSVGIGTTTPNSSAVLDIRSATKGLLIPRLTTAQRNAIVSPAKGLMAFDSSRNAFCYYNGTDWKEIGANFNADSNIIVGQQTGTIPSYNLNANLSKTDSSGIIYDSGGPSGNYGNNEDYTIDIGSNVTAVVFIDITVLSLNTESPYDSLAIFDDYNHRYILSGTTTGKYRFYGAVHIRFQSNSFNTQAGFAIRWDDLYTGGNNYYDGAQLSGWYFNPAKLYMRGGLNINNSWSPDSSGRLSFAYGENVQAKGDHGIAMGLSATAGNYSVAMGLGVTALNISTAIGYSNSANGYGASTLGMNNLASGDGATALGYYSSATGQSAVAIGSNCIATTNGAVAIGTSNSASGVYSIAIGYGAIASGVASVSLGNGSRASSPNSFATGFGNASGSYSAASGYATRSKSFACFTVGLYNDSTNAADQYNPNNLNRIFQVGNGTNEFTRGNALTILQNGNIGIGELNPAYPLNFRPFFGDKISLFGTGFNHYGFGIQTNLMQIYTDVAAADIAFGYGYSFSFNETMRIKGTGDGSLKGNLTVQNGKGLIRSVDGTQKKQLSTTVVVNPTLAAGASTAINFTFPEAFSSAPDVYVGNVISGSGGWAEVIMSIGNVTTTGGALYINNPRAVSATPNFTVKIIAIGAQ